MNLRFAEKGDTEALIEMRVAYLREDGLTDDSAEKMIREKLSDYIPRAINDSLFCAIAEEDGVICAAAMLVIFEKPAGVSFTNGLTAEVFSVYTRPEYRRRGAAAAIMKLLIEKANEKGVSLIDLKATKDGYPLYKKLGFCEQGGEYTAMRRRM